GHCLDESRQPGVTGSAAGLGYRLGRKAGRLVTAGACDWRPLVQGRTIPGGHGIRRCNPDLASPLAIFEANPPLRTFEGYTFVARIESASCPREGPRPSRSIRH